MIPWQPWKEHLTGGIQPAGSVFRLHSVTMGEIAEMIRNLKTSHAYGNDLLDTTIVKLAAAALIPPITHVINLSLGTQIFPV